MPSFTNSSLAMRSSPRNGFSVAIRRMSRRSSSGMGGRPGRDLWRQNSRQPARCHRTIVSGRTTITHDRQSHNRESQARLKRVAASMRRGLTPRSLKSASCRRKTRFSASIDRRALAVSTSKPITSASRRKTVQAKAITPTSCHGFHACIRAQSRGSRFCGRQDATRGDVSACIRICRGQRCAAELDCRASPSGAVRTTASCKLEGQQRVVHGRTIRGAERRHDDSQRPITPRWLPCVVQPLVRIALMPVADVLCGRVRWLPTSGRLASVG